MLSSYLASRIPTLAESLVKTRFWWIGEKMHPRLMIYDSVTNLLWNANPDRSTATAAEAKKSIATIKLVEISGWRLPVKEEISSFAKATENPLQRGSLYSLCEEFYWLCEAGRIDLQKGYLGVARDDIGRVICCNSLFAKSLHQELIFSALEKDWELRPCGKDEADDLLAPIRIGSHKIAYAEVDYRACRLPKLEPAQFTDPNKGLWEFWGMEAARLAEQGVRARNPADDVKDWNIAIDFGTSSSVVAYDENGQHKLVRIGVRNFWEDKRPEHYENPTVLEIVDFEALIAAWQAEAYRPGVAWDDVRCSHEALHNLRNNETNPRVVASILGKIKQWALRAGDEFRLRLADQAGGIEHELAPLTARMPVKGQALSVGSEDPFDPVELYAWFLGMNINWRGRGIFLRYYMTFPVAYPKEVKEKILASFRRGLQRSLPVSLVAQPVFSDFCVEELASEPAAYAASALPALNIAPTTAGVAYGVFDFGGGTADFDFGYYRLPTAEEEDRGTEAVFEHFGAAGDRFLGGENLLENLAYRVFLHNLKVCRDKKIAFTRPLDADDFAGSEMFLEKTQAAATNTLMLMGRLRPLWESGALPNRQGVERMDLLSREGQKIPCELSIPESALQTYLEERIEQGVHNFFAALKKAFAERMPEHIDVLLAGNASRSRLVAGLFGLLEDDEASQALFARTSAYLEKLFGGIRPGITAHPPLAVDEDEVYRPTAKTGVALGLLRLCPGSSIDVINHASRAAEGEAPFAHYVGRIRLGSFQVGLSQGDAYGAWQEVGIPRERVFNLYHSQSPRAHTGEMQEGEAGLYKMRLDLAGNCSGQKAFARPIGPASIEFCTAASRAAIGQGDMDNLRVISLA